MIRILHTSDLQLGMTRRFFDHEAQARYTDDQFDSLRSLAMIASERDCDAVVIAGDVFDVVLPDRRIVTRAIDALGSFVVPVFLLHGSSSSLALPSTRLDQWLQLTKLNGDHPARRNQ